MMNARCLLSRAAALFALAALGACATHESAGFGAAAPLGYASGSALGAGLGPREEAALARAFAAAMETGVSGAPTAWSSGDYQGSVTPGGRLVAGLKPDDGAMLPVSAPIDLSFPLETELGLYAVTSTANVRAGPSLKARVLGQLGAGTAVDVVGKTPREPWMLVAVDGKLRGYVHQSLMIRAPGADLTLAGGPTRTPVLCRPFEERLAYRGESDRWTGVSCKRDGRWRVEPAPAPAANAPAMLSN
ncbi:MAG: SH3 domain-containing protein [Alphaproteobacteria bacterium]|nr:SH3 domain-containing protein [Alphaproteobacteria bacterium]